MPDNNSDVENLIARSISVPSILDINPSTGDPYYTDAELNSEYHAKIEYQDAIENYGVIYKTVQFSEISDPEELKTACREWIRRNYYDGVLSFNVKAVDLHLLGYDTDKIMVGDRIPVSFIDVYPVPTVKVLTCISAQIDLLKPENNSYKIGIPDVSANVKYRKSLTKKSSSKSASGVDNQEKAKADYNVLNVTNKFLDYAGIYLGNIDD